MGSTPFSGRASQRSPRRWRTAVLSAFLGAMLGGAGAQAVLADEPVAAEVGAAHATVTLRKGDHGPAVRSVQRRLRIPADGVFGSQTDRAVRRFQRRKGLVADGIVGPITRRALRLRPFSRDSVIHPPGRGDGGGGGGLPNLPPVLRRIAECESGGNPRVVSADGRYRGKYQFTRSTWKEYGGRGDDPAEASEAHQDRVALRLYRARGTAPWPACSG